MKQKAPVTGLLAHKIVRVFVEREPDVMRAIAAFANGELPKNEITVAGPPDAAGMAYVRRHKSLEGCPLPTVVFKLAMTTNPLDGERGVRIEVSDRELDEMRRWQRDYVLAKLTQQRPAIGRGLRH